MGRALWRELVIGFAVQLGELRLGFTQLAALYVLADGGTMTVGELAEAIGRSPSATSRLVDGLVRRRLVERHQEPRTAASGRSADPARHAVLRVVDRAARTSSCRPSGRCRPPSGRSSRWAWPPWRPTRSPAAAGSSGRRASGVGADRARPHGGRSDGSTRSAEFRIQHRHTTARGAARAELAPRPGRARSRATWRRGALRCKACDEEVASATGDDPRPTRADAARRPGSAAEAADHVVQDRQAPAQRVDRDALVDAVEALEEPLVGVEPERREAVGRDAERGRCAWRRSRTGP